MFSNGWLVFSFIVMRRISASNERRYHFNAPSMFCYMYTKPTSANEKLFTTDISYLLPLDVWIPWFIIYSFAFLILKISLKVEREMSEEGRYILYKKNMHFPSTNIVYTNERHVNYSLYRTEIVRSRRVRLHKYSYSPSETWIFIIAVST